MFEETILPERSSNLRKNGTKVLKITMDTTNLNDLFLINHNQFLTQNLKSSDFIIKPNNYYMIINNRTKKIKLEYSEDVANHEIIYNPYKYEFSNKEVFNPEIFKKDHRIPEGYIDVLTKWYSIKFTYPEYNLIYIKPEMGLSIQIHFQRSERWKVLDGNPIIINGKNVYYYVDIGHTFFNDIEMYHSVINPNTDPNAYIIIREEWSGNFDEKDINRVFNPNHYS